MDKRDSDLEFQFSCLHCGGCCRIRGSVRVSESEIERLARFMSVPAQRFIDRYTRLAQNRAGLELEEKENGECVFLSGGECGVHTVKPAQCRTFPVEWRYPGVEEICPGINR